MFLTFCAYLALGICLAGILWRLFGWFGRSVGSETGAATPGERCKAVTKAVMATVFSPQVVKVIGALFFDVMLQRQIAKQSLARWAMHMGLFYGVFGLVVLHALDDLVVARWIGSYASTLNPYMFLRHLLGFLLLLGVAIAWVRRKKLSVLKRFSNWTDRLTLILLISILVSGIGLEAVQIISPSLFDEMVVDYMGSDDPEEIAPLKSYWAVYFDVGFETPPADEADALEQGRELHVAFCAECHSRPRSAFMSYPLARMLKPMSHALDRIQLSYWLWYGHYLLSCLALAYLPFGKFFHLISVPVSLAVKAVGSAKENAPESRPVRRRMGLDACTHCGVCSRHCSVSPILTVIDNPTILPSEKTGAVDALALERLDPKQRWTLAQGNEICTLCGRCTDICPSGIDLQDLWEAAQNELTTQGFSAPHHWIRTQSAIAWAESIDPKEINRERPKPIEEGLGIADNPDTFWACVQCTTCTNVCPVVAASDNPREDLDFTPQQVMNMMRLELKHMAIGCRMVWDCVTCYKCQEHCPQGVPVADVLYELRNEACRRLNPGSGTNTRRTGSQGKKA